jgi:hypothetical protein
MAPLAVFKLIQLEAKTVYAKHPRFGFIGEAYGPSKDIEFIL